MNQSDLDVLVPQSRVLELAGKSVTISPLVLGELPAMVKAVRPFAAQLTGDLATDSTSDPAGDPDWLALLSEHGEALLAALALASRQPRDWVDALALDDAMTLAAAVFEVNADFFVRRVAPRIGDLAQSMSSRLAGQTPLPA